MKLKKWFKGLLSAVFGGVANSIALIIADPINFNLSDGKQKLATVAITSAILSAAMYIKKSPLED